APWARPDLESVLAGSLPQREVAGMSLARIDLAAGAGEEAVGAVAGQPPVGRKAGDVVINGPADLIGVTLVDEPADDVDHLWDVGGGPRVVRRGPDVDRGRVLHERIRVVLRDLLGRPLLQPGADQHLVFAAVESVVRQVSDI